MTQATARDLTYALLGYGASVRVDQRPDGQWVVSASKPGGVTPTQLRNLETTYAVSAQLDEAIFV